MPTPKEHDVYAVGYEDVDGTPNATLWKNGEKYTLSENKSYARSIFIDNGDVYIAGLDFEGESCYATVWKNGTKMTPALTENPSDAKSVFVENGNVYVSGYEMVGSRQDAVVWKNGVKTTLSLPDQGFSTGWDVCVDNENVFIAGAVGAPAGSARAYDATTWKNGTPTRIEQETASTLNSIFVENGDAYIAGSRLVNSIYVSTVWKNGTIISSDQSGEDSFGESIFIDNGDLYVAGSANGKATIWKNGTQAQLTERSRAYSVFVKDGDVYAAGYESEGSLYDFTWVTFAVIWKNGTKTMLSEKASTVSSIFVVER